VFERVRLAVAGGDAIRWGRTLALGTSALAIATVLVVMALRFFSPVALEWMEGGIVDHVRVVLAGEPLYREPSLEFTPFLYTPLYYWVCAPLAAIFGASFQAARIVSIVAILASFWTLHVIVRRETGERVAAWLALGLFAATYGHADRWFDIARPDSLALAFLLGGIALARFGRTSAHAAVTGVLFFAAFFTKQSMLPICAPALAWLLLRSRRHGLVAGATLGTTGLVACAWMSRASDGWFDWYVFVMPGEHHIHWNEWANVLVANLAIPVAPMVLGACAVALGPVSPRTRDRWLWPALAGVAAWTGWMGLLHDGGGVNAFIPAYALLAIASGLAVAWLRPRVPTVELVVLVQLGLLAYEPWRYVPRAKDEAALASALAEIAAKDGEVWMPGFGYYLTRIDRPAMQAHSMALLDVFKTNNERLREQLGDEIRRALRRRRFVAVVFGVDLDLMPPELREPLERYYVLDDHLFTGYRHAGLPTSGFSARPDRVFVPKPHRGRVTRREP
jgi:4-amino-4-deoxy-L-arabinose transferase-like glycosyltransferase